MGIISHHIVYYGRRRGRSRAEGGPRYRCLACGRTFPSVRRVCPDCSGTVRRLRDAD